MNIYLVQSTKLVSISVSVLGAVALISCGSKSSSSTTPAAAADINALAASNADLSSLVSLVKLCDLGSVFSAAGPTTLFAPNNAAIKEALGATLPTTCSESLKAILSYHVLSKKVVAADIKASEAEVVTLKGNVYVKTKDGSVLINNSAKVTTADVSASNGVVHIIDKVLFPDSVASVVSIASKRDGFSTLVSLVKLCDLATTLSDASKTYTVFAPTNAAFTTYLAGGAAPTACTDGLKQILLGHVLGSKVASSAITATEAEVASLSGNIYAKTSSGSVVINNSAKVSAADLTASNGIVHVVDTVLIPDSQGTVVSIAAKRDVFSTLVSLVKLCDLATTLSDASKKYTVFAPTNTAFTTYLAGAAAPTICADSLKNTLLYHVLGSQVASSALVASQAVESAYTANKVFVTKTDADGVKVNAGSKVTTADLTGTNGVVHVVDKVLVPDIQGTVVDALSKRYDHTTLVSSVVKAGLATPLIEAGPFTVFAPTNAAFAETTTAAFVAARSNAELANVLRHHVLGSKVLAAAITGTNTPTTALWQILSVSLTGGSVYVRGSSQSALLDAAAPKVTEADIVASNGVVHVINKALVPTSY